MKWTWWSRNTIGQESWRLNVRTISQGILRPEDLSHKLWIYANRDKTGLHLYSQTTSCHFGEGSLQYQSMYPGLQFESPNSLNHPPLGLNRLLSLTRVTPKTYFKLWVMVQTQMKNIILFTQPINISSKTLFLNNQEFKWQSNHQN